VTWSFTRLDQASSEQSSNKPRHASCKGSPAMQLPCQTQPGGRAARQLVTDLWATCAF